MSALFISVANPKHCMMRTPPKLQFEPSHLVNFGFDADLDPAFDFDADPYADPLPKMIRILADPYSHRSQKPDPDG